MNKLISSATKIAAVVLLVITVGLYCVTPAMALTEQEQKELINSATNLLEQAPEFNWDNIIALKDVEGMFTPLDVSSYYEACSKIDTEAFSFSKLEFDVNAATTSVEALNLRYVTMLNELNELGYGTLSELEIPNTTPGYSTNIVESFNAIYGDLSERENISANIPDGWNMEDLMAQASAKRNAEIEEAKGNMAFVTTRDTLSLSESLAFAQHVIGTPELKSPLELDRMLNESSEAFEAKWSTENSRAIRNIQNIASNNDAEITIQSQEDLQDLFDTNVGETQEWLNTNIGKNIGSQKEIQMLEDMLNFTQFYEYILLDPKGEMSFDELWDAYEDENGNMSIEEIAKMATAYGHLHDGDTTGWDAYNQLLEDAYNDDKWNNNNNDNSFGFDNTWE